MNVQAKRGRKPPAFERRQVRWKLPCEVLDALDEEAQAKLSSQPAIVLERLLRDLEAHPFQGSSRSTPEDSPADAVD